MPNCIDCEWARQIGDKTRTDVVGCALLSTSTISPSSVIGDLYEGWMYPQRRPGDVADSKELGKGAMINGPSLVSAQAECPSYKERK